MAAAWLAACAFGADWFVVGADNRYIDGHFDHPQLIESAGELVGQEVGAMLPEKVSRLQRAAVDRARQTGQPQTIQYDLELAPGATHHFEARVTPMIDGQVLFLTSDITDRKVADAVAGITSFTGTTGDRKSVV